MTPQNSITPDDYATPEQIARNVERLKRLGDPDRTGNLLAEWEAEQRAEQLRAYEQRAAECAAEDARRARGDDLPLFAA